MREKLTIFFNKEELDKISADILDAGLRPIDVARSFYPHLTMNHTLAKLRGDSGFSESQFKELTRIIKEAKKENQKIRAKKIFR